MLKYQKATKMTCYHNVDGDILYWWFWRLSEIFCFDTELHCCIRAIFVNLRNFVNRYFSRCTVNLNVKRIINACRFVENCTVVTTVYIWCLKRKQFFITSCCHISANPPLIIGYLFLKNINKNGIIYNINMQEKVNLEIKGFSTLKHIDQCMYEDY